MPHPARYCILRFEAATANKRVGCPGACAQNGAHTTAQNRGSGVKPRRRGAGAGGGPCRGARGRAGPECHSGAAAPAAGRGAWGRAGPECHSRGAGPRRPRMPLGGGGPAAGRGARGRAGPECHLQGAGPRRPRMPLGGGGAAQAQGAGPRRPQIDLPRLRPHATIPPEQPVAASDDPPDQTRYRIARSGPSAGAFVSCSEGAPPSKSRSPQPPPTASVCTRLRRRVSGLSWLGPS
jgi:hypothetical protein